MPQCDQGGQDKLMASLRSAFNLSMSPEKSAAHAELIQMQPNSPLITHSLGPPLRGMG